MPCPHGTLSAIESALPRCDPHDDVAVAFATPPHRAEPVDHRGLKPDEALALRVELRLVGHRAERERPGNRLEGSKATAVMAMRIIRGKFFAERPTIIRHRGLC